MKNWIIFRTRDILAFLRPGWNLFLNVVKIWEILGFLSFKFLKNLMKNSCLNRNIFPNFGKIKQNLGKFGHFCDFLIRYRILSCRDFNDDSKWPQTNSKQLCVCKDEKNFLKIQKIFKTLNFKNWENDLPRPWTGKVRKYRRKFENSRGTKPQKGTKFEKGGLRSP